MNKGDHPVQEIHILNNGEKTMTPNVMHLPPYLTALVTPEKLEQGKLKKCLYYDIGKCKAPCIGLQTREDYLQQIDEIKEILSGNTRNLCQKLLEEMQTLAEKEQFLEAEKVKQKLSHLN